ncbi:class I SAM-dependent methyltransferase [Deinococcus sp. HMF7604]|uniref:class I SAM-dependent methyltransferase n=1 Tax=Deinococcus betulae TaxID=2873312 RepID=UPI001CCC66D0|nr:class I SAM-dependent methyltransferase [Deinococcus betulae]
MNVPADPLTRWRDLVLSARSERYRPDRDLAFWQAKAADYDHTQPALPNTVSWLRGDLHRTWSLLDVGAGTGRLLLPLVGAVAQATALDYSPDMLAQLRARGAPPHLRTVCCSLEEAPDQVPVHDAVLAAWSLAYQPELRPALETLRRLSRHALYLLEDDGVGSPHVQLRRALAGTPKPGRARLLREALEALGWPVTAQAITESRELTFTTTAEMLTFARLPLSEAQSLAALKPYLRQEAGGWRYCWTFEITVLRVACGAPA